MSDQINQIQATYQPLEDRILLKFKTLNDHVYLAWVTRRFCKLLLPSLHGLHPSTGDYLFDHDETAQNDQRKEQRQQQGDFLSDYEPPENPEFPLGEDPVLLAKIRFQDLHKPSLAAFMLEPNQGKGLVLPFHPDLTGPLLKILNQALDNADWNLGQDLSIPKSQMLQ
ncbi:hypothetical protein THMIRHAS_24660 [Thiosulfatimonas sediminis]|uniref:Uncharacterized protein n=1 Tax=Thiosulfatimonas sediminis TaxID=2675054 RepID=A0A6F8PY71_9GAMM|nr:hypothetical protein [Thiosulfatimonas sediminis]BBP47093.1 hypothetical protein THMIRHAS_24660 [Thiosulfatimonas sediminis]